MTRKRKAPDALAMRNGNKGSEGAGKRARDVIDLTNSDDENAEAYSEEDVGTPNESKRRKRGSLPSLQPQHVLESRGHTTPARFLMYGGTGSGTSGNFSIRAPPTEHVDLSSDPHQQPSSYAPPSQQSSAPQPEVIEIDSDDEGNEVIAWSQEDESPEETSVYGVLHTKIVGIRYYNGTATKGETVRLRREPTNQYDRNAIRADNVQRAQVGHLPRGVAAKLAHYMDSRSLALHATLAAAPGPYDVALDVALIGPAEAAARAALVERMRRDKLPVQAAGKLAREEKKRKAVELKRAADQGFRGAAGGFRRGGCEGPSFDELAGGSQVYNPREMGQVVEKYGADEAVLAALPSVETPAGLATELLPYQKQGLAWMLDKENPKLPEKGSQDVVQMWKRSGPGGSAFMNIATSFSTKKEPELASGGILADDMGLGKTLQIIALIVADQTTYTAKNEKSRATLIVAPLSVMSNWSGQIEQHLKRSHALRVLIYHGSNRASMKAAEFADYDVVITTYGTFSQEHLPRKNEKALPVPRSRGLFSVKWRRVVLDEGHIIRNPATKAAQAACAVLARSRWVLTGTPIINNLKDLYSIVRFVGLTGGLEDLSIFNNILIRPLRQGDENAMLLLQALMATLCLRRRKDMAFIDLKLPSLTEYIHHVTLGKSEREKYDALLKEARGQLQEYRAQSDHGQGKDAQQSYRHLLEILLRMRQVCNHWRMCSERVLNLMEALAENKLVDLTPENVKALQEVLALSIESRDDCAVCLEELTGHSPTATPCGHVFGRDCIVRVIETQHKCPMCRAQLANENVLVEPAADLGVEDGPKVDDDEEPSAKVTALLKILSASRKKDPDRKTVIFSQWCRFLDLLEPHLAALGIRTARIDGSMPAAARDAALRELQRDDRGGATVLLASLGVCAVGLNLTAASQVVLCDSWWAPAIEDQAVDRVHRLGQARACTVWRLVVRDSVEERTLEVQQEKRALASVALREEGARGRERGRGRVGDIERLLEA